MLYGLLKKRGGSEINLIDVMKKDLIKLVYDMGSAAKIQGRPYKLVGLGLLFGDLRENMERPKRNL